MDSHVLGEELTAMYAEDENDKKNIAVVCTGSRPSTATSPC